jgi:hypothetical protein
VHARVSQRRRGEEVGAVGAEVERLLLQERERHEVLGRALVHAALGVEQAHVSDADLRHLDPWQLPAGCGRRREDDAALEALAEHAHAGVEVALRDDVHGRVLAVRAELADLEPRDDVVQLLDDQVRLGPVHWRERRRAQQRYRHRGGVARRRRPVVAHLVPALHALEVRRPERREELDGGVALPEVREHLRRDDDGERPAELELGQRGRVHVQHRRREHLLGCQGQADERRESDLEVHGGEVVGEEALDGVDGQEEHELTARRKGRDGRGGRRRAGRGRRGLRPAGGGDDVRDLEVHTTRADRLGGVPAEDGHGGRAREPARERDERVPDERVLGRRCCP